MDSLFAAARQCLDAADPAEKAALARRHAAAFAAGGLRIPGDAPPPEPFPALLQDAEVICTVAA